MSSDASVTHWLKLLQAGARDAGGPLWQRDSPLLVARKLAVIRALWRQEEHP